MKYTFRHILSVFLCWLTAVSLSAQFAAPGRYSAVATSYSGADSLYFFSSFESSKLMVSASEQSSFRWLKYNSATGLFDVELATDNGTQSSINITSDGGYRVEVVDSQNATSYTGWCFSPSVDSVTIAEVEATCYLLSLESGVYGNSITYYNPANNQPFEYHQKYDYKWTTDTGQSIYNNTLPMLDGLDAPVENTKFTLTVTNDAGKVFVQECDFEALAVSASFEFEVDDRGWLHELGDEKELSAPAVLKFDNTSKGNVTANEWLFTWRYDEETNTSREFENSPIYTFQQPGNYTLSLQVTNERSGCVSESEEKQIQVMESYIEFPNVFTPNGDGVNDEFRPSFESIKSYNIVIYNRWGTKVYSSSDISTGWNGKIGNRDAAEGVYYYMSESHGYRKGERHRRKGSVTLLR